MAEIPSGSQHTSVLKGLGRPGDYQPTIEVVGYVSEIRFRIYPEIAHHFRDGEILSKCSPAGTAERPRFRAVSNMLPSPRDSEDRVTINPSLTAMCRKSDLEFIRK